jgi:hypothetical protein
VKSLLVRIVKSPTLRIVALTVAMISGIDDLLETWFGIADMFHLDVAHGVVLTALTGVLEPLAKLFEENEKMLSRLGGDEA